MIWLYILIFIGSCLLLVNAGTWLVKSLTRVSQTLKWSKFLISFFLTVFAASLPEFFVGLNSAFHKLPQLSFGNVIGANILNLTLGIAICVLLTGSLKLESRALRTDSIFAAFVIFLPLLLMLDGGVSRTDGIILLLAFFLYLRKILQKDERFSGTFIENFKKNYRQFKLFLKDLAIFFGVIFLLILSAEGIVRTANIFTLEINLPLITTGIFLVALGTVLPELFFRLKAVSLENKEVVLENFMGSVVVNSTFVLGIVFLISPLKIVDFSPYLVGIFFTVFSALGFVIFSLTHREITRREAVGLIVICVLFFIIQFLISQNLIF